MSFACPCCNTEYATPPLWVVPRQGPGDIRPIYQCAFCKVRICIGCYVRHIEKAHPKLYRTPPRGVQ